MWITKDLNIGGSRLTNTNFASLGSQVKFIDNMKYYLLSLGILASTLDDVEKLTLQFLNQHDYFLQIWPLLDFDQKRKVLDIIVTRKGVIPYDKIVSIDSLNSKPENGFCFFYER